jgi:hypothetical protein
MESLQEVLDHHRFILHELAHSMVSISNSVFGYSNVLGLKSEFEYEIFSSKIITILDNLIVNKETVGNQ